MDFQRNDNDAAMPVQQHLFLFVRSAATKTDKICTGSDLAALAGSAVRRAAGSPPDTATRRPRNPRGSMDLSRGEAAWNHLREVKCEARYSVQDVESVSTYRS